MCCGCLAALAAGAQTNAPPSDRMEFADGLYVRGMYDLAVKEYLLVIRDEPPGVAIDAALFRAGECHRQLGRREMAERYYKRILTDFPQSPHRFLAEFRRAELFVTAGQYLDGANLLRALLDAGPPDDVAASAAYFLGTSLDKLGQAGEAEQHLQTVIDRHPKSPFYGYACQALADLGQRTGKPAAEVRDLYRRAAEQPATPRAGAEALFQWAEHAFKAGDFEESAKAYEQLLEKYPGDRRVPEARLQIAWAFLQSGKNAAALKLAEERLAAGEEAGREDWLYIKANALRQLQRTDLALAAYDELMMQFPSGPRRPAAAYEKALIAFRRGQHEKVVEQLAGLAPSAAVEEDRGWLLAESYAALNRSAEALEQFQALAEKFPESDRAAQALYRQAELQQAAEDFAAAAEACRKIAEKYSRDPLVPDALFTAGYCHARLDRHDEALRDWTALLEKHPDYRQSDVALYQVAVAQIRLGKESDARRTLERLLKDYSKTERAVDALVALSILHEQAGKLDKAEEAVRDALARKPAEAELPRLKYRLATLLQKQGREDESAALLQALLDTPIRRDMPPAMLEWLADLQLRHEAPADALKAAQALADQAGTPEWKQIGWYWVGRSREAAGEQDRALEAYARALDQEARTLEAAESALRLGDLRLATGDAALAETAYQAAAERATEPEAMSLRARSYFGLGRAAAARENWEDAARFYMSVAVLYDDPELAPRSLHEAAAAFDRLGRGEDRQKAVDELTARYPDSEWAKELAGKQAPPTIP
ncbi:MAG TPA: tetratricopeptide repeat protein [Kiritimatiellia bacterium]|nr:tetratricopeptide repeat protein [Kiritimatiellia bacterium]HRZ13540.1 tetratricopeptide repeat protein [Kiritimatiellia bacterium]